MTVVPSVKCHPELAGCGVEYSWVKLKVDYRRKNSKGIYAPVSKGGSTTEEKLCRFKSTSLPIERVWKFESKARDYRRMHIVPDVSIRNMTIKELNVSYSHLEKMMKMRKSH
jgi:hypothetical protein